jgi:hypothetical protein
MYWQVSFNGTIGPFYLLKLEPKTIPVPNILRKRSDSSATLTFDKTAQPCDSLGRECSDQQRFHSPHGHCE